MKTRNKYLITGGIAVAAFTVIGASAFLTSSDQITNPFLSGTTRGQDAEILVVEDFRSTLTDNPKRAEAIYNDLSSTLDDLYGKPISGPNEVLPGEKFVKKVRVDSEANYYQYVRVKAIIDWDDTFIASLVSSKGLTTEAAVNYANSYLEIVFPDKGKALTAQNWLGGEPRYTFGYVNSYALSSPGGIILNDVATTGYLYYKYALAPENFTEDIITSVKLKANAGNEFKNAKFDVLVDAESVQATEDSWYNQWSSDLYPGGGDLETVTPPPAP